MEVSVRPTTYQPSSEGYELVSQCDTTSNNTPVLMYSSSIDDGSNDKDNNDQVFQVVASIDSNGEPESPAVCRTISNVSNQSSPSEPESPPRFVYRPRFGNAVDGYFGI